MTKTSEGPEGEDFDFKSVNEKEIKNEESSVDVSGFGSYMHPFQGVDANRLVASGITKFLSPNDMSKLATANLSRMISPINVQLDVLNRSFAASLAKFTSPLIATAGMAKLVAELNASMPRILPGFNPTFFKKLSAQFKSSQPNNFQELRLTDQLKLIRMSVKHGFGTVESLPPEIIQLLLDTASAPASEVDSLLADSSSVIVAYCNTKAQEVVELGFGPLVGYATLIVEAGDALSAGHDSSSQTLSTAIWDSSLTETFGKKMITQVKKSHGNSTEIDLENRDQRVTLREIYRKAAQFPAVSTYPASRNRSRYSRNGTIHYAAPEQFNKANAVKALTIACGVIAFSAKYNQSVSFDKVRSR